MYSDIVRILDTPETKDALITDMAEYISMFDTDEDICKHVSTGLNDAIGCEEQGRHCVPCIVEWFYKKVKK